MWVDHVLGQVGRDSSKLWDFFFVVLGRPVECVALGMGEDQNDLAIFFLGVGNMSCEVVLPFEPLFPVVSLPSYAHHIFS